MAYASDERELSREELQAKLQRLAREISSDLAALESVQSKELLSDFVSQLFLSAADQRRREGRRQKQAEGIAKGGAEGTFSSSRPLTWKEAAVFLGRTAEALGLKPDPAAKRMGPVPAALGGSQDAVTQAWDLGLLPADADFTGGLTRSQGEKLAEALKALTA